MFGHWLLQFKKKNKKTRKLHRLRFMPPYTSKDPKDRSFSSCLVPRSNQFSCLPIIRTVFVPLTPLNQPNQPNTIQCNATGLHSTARSNAGHLHHRLGVPGYVRILPEGTEQRRPVPPETKKEVKKSVSYSAVVHRIPTTLSRPICAVHSFTDDLQRQRGASSPSSP